MIGDRKEEQRKRHRHTEIEAGRYAEGQTGIHVGYDQREKERI